jgi:hypothetical protein
MIRTLEELEARVGQTSVLEGLVAKVPWQHMIQMVPDKRVEYFDLSDEAQIVGYVPEGFACSGGVRLSGQVLRLQGPGKRHKEGDAELSEVQLDVESWQCLAPEAESPSASPADPSSGPD